MDVHALLIVQAVADLLLGGAIVFLLFRLGKDADRRPEAAEEAVRRLNDALRESEQSGRQFLSALEEARETLVESIRRAERSQSALNAAAARAEAAEQALAAVRERSDAVEGGGKDYGGVAAMIAAGMTERDIAARSGLPEGEIALIGDLLRAKHEPV